MGSNRLPGKFPQLRDGRTERRRAERDAIRKRVCPGSAESQVRGAGGRDLAVEAVSGEGRLTSDRARHWTPRGLPQTLDLIRRVPDLLGPPLTCMSEVAHVPR